MGTMHDRQRAHHLDWARPWHEMLVAERADAGVIDCGLRHLWPGEIDQRRSRERRDGLTPHVFDPFTEMVYDDPGSWRWSIDKPAMHDDVRSDVASRQEDGRWQSVAGGGTPFHELRASGRRPLRITEGIRSC